MLFLLLSFSLNKSKCSNFDKLQLCYAGVYNQQSEAHNPLVLKKSRLVGCKSREKPSQEIYKISISFFFVLIRLLSKLIFISVVFDYLLKTFSFLLHG